MGELRARALPAEGPAAVWDPADQERFRALAGSLFVRANPDGTATVLAEGGGEVTVHPGWVVRLPDGAGDGRAVFSTPERVEILPG